MLGRVLLLLALILAGFTAATAASAKWWCYKIDGSTVCEYLGGPGPGPPPP